MPCRQHLAPWRRDGLVGLPGRGHIQITHRLDGLDDPAISDQLAPDYRSLLERLSATYANGSHLVRKPSLRQENRGPANILLGDINVLADARQLHEINVPLDVPAGRAGACPGQAGARRERPHADAGERGGEQHLFEGGVSLPHEGRREGAAVRAAAPYPMPDDPDARREARSFTSSFTSSFTAK